MLFPSNLQNNYICCACPSQSSPSQCRNCLLLSQSGSVGCLVGISLESCLWCRTWGHRLPPPDSRASPHIGDGTLPFLRWSWSLPLHIVCWSWGLLGRKGVPTIFCTIGLWSCPWLSWTCFSACRDGRVPPWFPRGCISYSYHQRLFSSARSFFLKGLEPLAPPC